MDAGEAGTGRLGRTFVYDARAALDVTDVTEARAAQLPAAPPNPIEAMDAWARYIWHARRRSPQMLVAVPVWLAIRVLYRITSFIATIWHLLQRPPVWMFWRLYELFGPLARLCKSVFWRLYTLCGPAARALKAAYWRGVYPIIALAWRALRWAYWRIVHPVVSWSGFRRIYWKIAFPIIEAPARWLGFSLVKRSGASPDPLHEKEQAPREAFRGPFGRGFRSDDAIALVAHSLADFEALFDCLPRLGLSEPMAAPLYVYFARDFAETEAMQVRLLGLRLRNGAPCRTVFLYSESGAAARSIEEALGAPVTALRGCDSADFVAMVAARTLTEPPSLVVERFGPVVLLISALWGRVGSTLIFDAQTQFLLENGAIVVRIFVDHNPRHGAAGLQRRATLLGENLTQTHPHLICICERDEGAQRRSTLRSRHDYKTRSGLRRYELELEGARALDEGVLAWAGGAARLSIVNHAMHMAFAERISDAPIVLETHDVLAHQVESHGWPAFVSLKNEPTLLRGEDQQSMWRRAAACVNLSPDDDATIAPHAARSLFVRPTAAAAALQLRPWAEVVRANGLSSKFAANEEIDILLWGDWHEGNARAAQWLLERVRPLDPALMQARIAIAGRVTRLLPARLRNLPNVVTCDFVDKLDDLFGRAKVLAIADQEGSGVSIKAIEVIRFGVPFVSTCAGLRGLDLSMTDYRPAETAAAFASDLSTLIADPAKRTARALIARELYRRNISHDTYEEQWRKVISEVDPSFSVESNEARLAAAPMADTPGPALALRLCEPVRVEARASANPKPAVHARATHALAAVVCTYNRYDVLPGAIESLLAQDIEPDELDILVIDNSPDQDAAAAFGARYQGARVRYILEPTPGLSNARNVGANASGAKYVAYIDDDAVAAPDWARNLLAALQRFSPHAGVAGGRIIPRWVTPQPDWLPNELIGNLSIVDWGGVARPLGLTEWIAGCNIAFDRQMLLELGGFSRALGRIGSGAALLSNEESEVIEKFADAGKIAVYVPEATVEHLIEPARVSQEWFRRRAAWQAVSDYIKDPKKTAAYAGAAAERLRRELLSDDDTLPPGFVRPHAEREAFRRDVGLMYDIVVAMLAGGVELNEDGRSSASLHDRLVANVRREVQRSPQLRAAIRKLANL